MGVAISSSNVRGYFSTDRRSLNHGSSRASSTTWTIFHLRSRVGGFGGYVNQFCLEVLSVFGSEVSYGLSTSWTTSSVAVLTTSSINTSTIGSSTESSTVADLPALEPLVEASPLEVSLVVVVFLDDSDSLVILLLDFLP
uniref:Uncharacterized protein n=1 Tax=Tanacetum cinerariifolium TaxID=118510 RepID=A0A6L2KM37_TANCI|nr:hypothetical protein [Tanacetum cinerariifolium]